MQISIYLKRTVLQRDDNRCARCGGSEDLDCYVLHEPGSTYNRSTKEYEHNPLMVGDCTTLCHECAEKTRAERDAKAAAEMARKARPKVKPEPLFGGEVRGRYLKPSPNAPALWSRW